jgi:hypothetical protein
MEGRRHSDRGAFDDIPVGSLPPGGGKKMAFTGMTVLKVENGLINLG